MPGQFPNRFGIAACPTKTITQRFQPYVGDLEIRPDRPRHDDRNRHQWMRANAAFNVSAQGFFSVAVDDATIRATAPT